MRKNRRKTYQCFGKQCERSPARARSSIAKREILQTRRCSMETRTEREKIRSPRREREGRSASVKIRSHDLQIEPTLRGFFLTVLAHIFATIYALECRILRWKALDEIYQSKCSCIIMNLSARKILANVRQQIWYFPCEAVNYEEELFPNFILAKFVLMFADLNASVSDFLRCFSISRKTLQFHEVCRVQFH